ncbi:MAG: hypothetical protein WHS46_14395 [Desulfosoma sp.]
MRRFRCVIDASVLIDCARGAILQSLFHLEADWMISDLAMAELNDPTPDTLHGLGLQVMALSGEDISQIIAIGSRYSALTVYDRAHLVLAQRERAILLTSNRRLREAAEQNGVTVRGTLWLLDELVAAGLLTTAAAAHALREMLAQGSRLPANECQRRLKAWEKQP